MKKNQGFSFIELLLSVFIISIGVLAGVAVIQKSTSFTSLSVSRRQAYLLAKEGIEVIRNIRDTSWLNGEDPFVVRQSGGSIVWPPDHIGVLVSPPGPFSGTVYLDCFSEEFPDSNCTNRPYLAFDGEFLRCSAKGKFKREVTLTFSGQKGTSFAQISVASKVEWTEGGSSHEVLLYQTLYNWR